MTRRKLWAAWETATAQGDTAELERLAGLRLGLSSAYRHKPGCWCGLCRDVGDSLIPGEALVVYSIKIPAAVREALRGRTAEARAALEKIVQK